ncbi:MAG: polysaccharide biosynthesis/export family protein [Nitrospirota bacterium]
MVTIIKTLQNELIQGIMGILLFLLLLLTACARNEIRPESVLSQHAAAGKANALNIRLSQNNMGIQRTFAVSDYKIGPEDLLEIHVFQVNDLNTVVRVSATGQIKLPLIEKIEAAGLTVAELEALISQKLEKFVQEPVVSVFIKEYRSQQIAVLGSVKNPSVYYVTGQRYLLDLLSMAGGLSQDAGDVCILQRVGNRQKVNDGSEAQNGENIEQIVIDLDALLMQGRMDLNLPLSSGDVIHVPEAGIFFVDGAVNSPGSFKLKGKMTFTQAISMARGLSYHAIKSDIKLYRENDKQQRDVITIDYDDILDMKIPDIELKDRDIIIVSSSGFKKFIGGLAGYFNFGYFGFSGVQPGRGF